MPLVVQHLKLPSLDCHALLLIVFVLILITIDWFSGLLLVQLLKMLTVARIHGRRLRIPNVWNHGMVVISLVRLNTISTLIVKIK